MVYSKHKMETPKAPRILGNTMNQLLASSYHNLKTVYSHRSMIFDLVKRDFKVRYLGSIFGSYWNFIHPVALIAIYVIVFAKIMKLKFPDSTGTYGFTIYLCAGIIPWTAFCEMLTRCTNIFREQAAVIKKVYFPKEILQFIAAGSSAITLCIGFTLLCLMLVITGYQMGPSLFFLPMAIALQIIFASSLGIILAIFNVFFSDVLQSVQIILQIWFWLTPIVYRFEQIPEVLHPIAKLNPFFHIHRLYEEIIFSSQIPSFKHWLVPGAMCAILYVISATMLSHFKNQISDEL